jgi:hypothetical protein
MFIITWRYLCFFSSTTTEIFSTAAGELFVHVGAGRTDFSRTRLACKTSGYNLLASSAIHPVMLDSGKRE